MWGMLKGLEEGGVEEAMKKMDAMKAIAAVNRVLYGVERNKD